MKYIFFSLIFVLLTTSCSNRSKQIVYDTINAKNRQDCLNEGRRDCPSAESYNKYKNNRDEVTKE